VIDYSKTPYQINTIAITNGYVVRQSIICPDCRQEIEFSNNVDMIGCLNCPFIGIPVYAAEPSNFVYDVVVFVHNLRNGEDYDDMGECISS